MGIDHRRRKGTGLVLRAAVKLLRIRTKSRVGSLIGYAIDLDFAIDNHARNDTRTGRRMFAEMLFEDCIESREVARIFKPYAATHNMLWPIACLLENRQEIANRLM